MSGLERFQDNATWRDKLRELLDCPVVPPKPQLTEAEQRYSLDVVEDFQALKEAKMTEYREPPQQFREEAEEEDEISSICHDNSIFAQDDTFNAYERMCDKTSSDPDSTLFQYLHSDNKEQVLALAKERSGIKDTSGNKSKEDAADSMRLLFENIAVEDQLDNESPVKGAECTQLEDIEAPSRLWDNTATMFNVDDDTESPLKLSPVKMVGLMRPSTIMEASETIASINSSGGKSSSFHSALKGSNSYETIASSCYETATDKSLDKNTDNSLSLHTDNSLSLVDVDDLFFATIAKAKPHGLSETEQKDLLLDLHQSLCMEKPQIESPLIEDETIIELSSSSSSDEEEDGNKEKDLLQIQLKEERRTSFIEDDNGNDNDNKENEKGEEVAENSLQFNDTMEEMEYMMQKGLDYMKSVVSQPSASAVVVPDVVAKQLLSKQSTFTGSSPQLLSKQSTFTLPSPSKIREGKAAQPSSSSPVVVGTSSPLRINNRDNKPPSTGSASVFSRDIKMVKNTPKLFKLPSGIPTRRQLDIKQQFAHIVSPIRTYTQKSVTTPLMTMLRPQNTDDLSSLAVAEFERESLLCRPITSSGHRDGTEFPKVIRGIPMDAQLLPKKAYISSDIKQYIDERSQLPMPNVAKIQKYLDSAKEPTVLRHEGKIKLPPTGGAAAGVSHIPRRPNYSLADLSLASGDVSLYTVKDAQKL